MRIVWEVDSFFADSEAPDDVLVDLNNIPYRDLGPTGRSIEIPPKDLEPFRGKILNVAVTFKWSGPPPTSKVSSVSIQVDGVVGPVGNGPSRPRVTLQGATLQTLQHPNQISLAWSSSSYNDGNILWGPISSPRMWSRSIKPEQAIYSGEWTTDRPLAPQVVYSFTVQVKNSLTTNTWVETTMAAKSAANAHSVRQFLDASGVKGSSLREEIGHGGSLRQVMGI